MYTFFSHLLFNKQAYNELVEISVCVCVYNQYFILWFQNGFAYILSSSSSGIWYTDSSAFLHEWWFQLKQRDEYTHTQKKWIVWCDETMAPNRCTTINPKNVEKNSMVYGFLLSILFLYFIDWLALHRNFLEITDCVDIFLYNIKTFSMKKNL